MKPLSEPLALACPKLSNLATNSVPARAAGTPFLGLASRKEQLSALDSGQIGSLVKSNGWHRSNNSFKPSPLRGLVQVPCKFHLPKAANRSVLTQALDRSRNKCRSTSVKPVSEPLALASSMLSSLATNSVPARAAGTPFLGLASRNERLSALDSGQISSLFKSTAGTGLTIRSSRARFAASCKLLQVSLAQGRKAARLNSGVRPGQKKSPVNKRQAKSACCLPSPHSDL